ncbi:hypothetical protein [Shewanella kaireitica]|nr:hypothetical protein [Shewanella kaireitica]
MLVLIHGQLFMSKSVPSGSSLLRYTDPKTILLSFMGNEVLGAI